MQIAQVLWHTHTHSLSLSLSLSLPSLSFITPSWFSWLHPMYASELIRIHLCWSTSTAVSMCKGTTLISSSLLLQLCLACFAGLGWLVRWKGGGQTTGVLWGAVPSFSSKQHVTFLCSSHLAFSPSASSRWCNNAVVPIQLRFGRNPSLFYLRDQISIWSTICLPYTYVDIAFNWRDIAAEAFLLVY